MNQPGATAFKKLTITIITLISSHPKWKEITAEIIKIFLGKFKSKRSWWNITKSFEKVIFIFIIIAGVVVSKLK